MHATGRCGIVTGMAMTRAIELRTEIPGPKSNEILERKEAVVAEPLSIFLPVVVDHAQGRDVDRRRRQHVSRFHGRRRLPERRPRAPAGRGGGAGAAGALLAHRLHHRPVRGLRHARRAALRARARAQTGQGRVLQRRHRGSRERDQVRALVHGAPGRDRLRGRLPRPHAALADADVQDTPVQGGPGAVRARGLSRAVSERVPRPERGRGARGARAGARHHGRGRDGCGDRARAGAGRRRVRGRAAGVRRGCAPPLRRQRHRARGRRGADGLRPHGPHVGHRPLRRRARPDHDREVDRRRPAALGRARQGRDHGRARRLGNRRHVRGQPRCAGRGARGPRRLRGGGPE